MSRSYLFIPGNTPSMLQNLDVFESDAIIIDFEDSVVDYEKDAARILVQNFLSQYEFKNIEIFIRINDALSKNFLKDVQAVDHIDITGYVLPKASPKSIKALYAITRKPIIPIIEDPMAVLHMEEIAQLPNIRGLLLGAEDLTKELHISRTLQGTEILYSRSRMVLVCHAYRIEAIDTPFTAKDQEAQLHEDALLAKNLGFTAKALIHPNHVDTINTVFSPSQAEINQALRIIKKSEEVQKGAFSLDGKMVDLPIIEKAKKTIAIAKKYHLL